MPRVRKPAKVKEPIRLRMKELANGNKKLVSGYIPEWQTDIRVSEDVPYSRNRL